MDRIEPRRASTPHAGSDWRKPSVCPTAKSSNRTAAIRYSMDAFIPASEDHGSGHHISCRAASNFTTTRELATFHPPESSAYVVETTWGILRGVGNPARRYNQYSSAPAKLF